MAAGVSAARPLSQRDSRGKKWTLTHTYDETKRGRGGVSNAASEQILDGVARLETRGGAFLPPGDGAPLRVHEPLLEDVVENILEVEHVGDINELCGHRPL